jgi:hypothetical protein
MKRTLVMRPSPAILLLAMALAPLAGMATDFTFTTIDFPGAAGTEPGSINAQGQIVGTYFPGLGGLPSHGFLWDKGTFSTIDFPGAAATTGLNANNPRGEIVGSYFDTSGGQHGFVLNRGTYTSVDAPFPGAAGETYLAGINPRGQIVGAYGFIPALVTGFLLDGGVFTKLPQFPGSTATGPNNVNASSHITGVWQDPNRNTFHGFLLVDGSFTELDDPEAGKLNCTGFAPFGTPNCSTAPIGLNDHDQIVGWFVKDDGTTHGFLLSQGIYSTIDFQGAAATALTGINDAGLLVGYYFDSSGLIHGFLATPAH